MGGGWHNRKNVISSGPMCLVWANEISCSETSSKSNGDRSRGVVINGVRVPVARFATELPESNRSIEIAYNPPVSDVGFNCYHCSVGR